MNRKKLLTIGIIATLGAAALFGAFAYGNTRLAAPVQAAPDNRLALQMPGRGIGDGSTQEDLANALGITVDELTAARQKANEAAIDQALEKGLITQAQADQLKQGGKAFPLAGRGNEWMSQNGIDYEALLADALGITTQKLQEAETQAFNARIDQAVTDGKLTQEQADLMKGRRALLSDETFRASMQSAFESAINAAVSSGVITQAQADQILKQAGTGLDGMGGFGGPGRFGPDFGGPGGRHGGWDDGNNQPQQPPADTQSGGGL
jgi:polyhydroxyalkanoate synthesis regulator phasin